MAGGCGWGDVIMIEPGDGLWWSYKHGGLGEGGYFDGCQGC